MKLSPIQEKIVETPGNLIVRASAGTGKTHTMVNKIAKEIDDNHTHKVIAAITFTIKAAQEIKDRLSVDVVQHFIGTNNSFVIEEVIKPFMKDVYGADFDLDMSTDYSAKVDTFQEAIEKIRNEGILCSYRDNKRNFIFDLAQEIVENSSACRLYLQAKYFKIYIDEYQDCDKSMHKFFMYLCDELNIETFVVGDEKQSIYIWRGAYPEAFKSIWNKPNFKKIFMGDNFRSCQQIQNYSNLLCDETRSLYNPTENIDNIVWLSPTKANWATEVLSNIVPDKKSALLRFSNDNARIGASELTTNGLEYVYIPQTPIADITTDTAWLYTAIAKYLIIEKYSAYDVISEMPNPNVMLELGYIGAWANRHRQYLKQHHRIRYYNLLTSERLYPYLADIEEQAQTMFSQLVKAFAEKENVTEKLKAYNPMLWVRKMNNIRNRAMEIVNGEVIFV